MNGTGETDGFDGTDQTGESGDTDVTGGFDETA